MRPYLELRLYARPEHMELLLAELWEWGFEGFEEDESLLRAYKPASEKDPDAEELLGLLRRWDPELRLELRRLEPEDWLSRWAELFEPVAVTPFWVRPPWKPAQVPEGHVELIIEPKMAFGTGHHASTRLVLRLLARWLRPGARMLDVGTGTGILAIGAIKLGAARAVAVDIDEFACENARENARLNKVEDRLEVRLGSLEAVSERGFDLITANLTRSAIEELLPELLRRRARRAPMVWSGLLASDEPLLQKTLHTHRLTLIERQAEQEWVAWVVR
ncbi:MAG: 50S ribosomal protein L11 methyltransferase [Bacteroidota bacterium]|nr:50S ribosomal protein L11 methyltransferase [Bacteroidota bacterium]MDW8138668.1 50S ribosomal protein L11 methyltransferase [Bacteroidota bacterium]MDW8284746.1 50S ribosomal protein L11 methyltransferase [Bacteroidota bacterium]